MNMYPKKQGLYDPAFEHDACGVGLVTNIDGKKSNDIVLKGIEVLNNLLHRGALAGDEKTGDGAGILVQIPDAFLRRECGSLGITLPPLENYGVGMIFLPQDKKERNKCKKLIEQVISEEGLFCLGWRDVPADSTDLGQKAKQEQPFIAQCFIDGKTFVDIDLERKLYVIRKVIENRVKDSIKDQDSFYVVSLSSRTIIYKGLLTGSQMISFYKDLNDKEFVSALAVIHQRYSTNTFPSWKLAQPFRYLAHNGEINTLRGNINQMKSREKLLKSDIFGDDIKKLLPVIDISGSDSACLDNMLELLVACGRDLSHAMMMLIPQAWGLKYPIGPDLRGFYEYHAGLMEPWDGPAAIAFTNGKQLGALLDRNGLRPARYTITKDGFMVLASEAGVLEFKPEDIVEKGTLKPGEIILVDLDKKRLIKNGEIKTFYSRRHPYRRWVQENKFELRGLFKDVDPMSADFQSLLKRQSLFGYTREDLKMIINPMAARGYEPVGSMGTDTPLAIFSEKPQLLYNYFKQLFAQITNPAIDPIREELVMSLMTFLGNVGNILTEIPQHAKLIKFRHPILSNNDLDRVCSLKMKEFCTTTLKMCFEYEGSGNDLEKALQKLCNDAEASVVKGCSIIILSDRDLEEGMTPIPALLAVSAVNQHLVRKSMKTVVGIVVETGEAREVQHMALLLGFGAAAVNPYLALETVANMSARKMFDQDVGIAKALENYINSLRKGLLKVLSKMGISTLRSYRGAQIFEVIGISSDVIDQYFTGTSSRIGGIGLDEIAKEANARYKRAYCQSPNEDKVLTEGGHYRSRKDGERHLWTAESVSKLQFAAKSNNYKIYKEYTSLIDDQSKNTSTIRGMFKFKKTKPISIDEVEPVSSIVKRFATSAMSFGSVSREIHETLAIAMNRLGAMSNSGEGGEDPERYKLMPNGDNKSSAVKQVASGRFGVTTEYLTNAREIQIKIAQGAKPGEGGQLPGHKVNEEIARVRHSTPGVTLISPPPHHDIYSIEDIKQLIFDLRNVNPQARVSVKLVSEAGIGTIAAGVAKAKADMVLISGYDGGTGASPLSSLKHAGAPWELGLAETQQTLVLNALRSSIRIQSDGQMKTGRDIIIAALLGAEEFGFATVPLVVCGCIMMRKCHLNTCPIGIATQDPELRKRFVGKPEHVVNFFNMIAGEIREYMAELGIKKMDDMIGRSDLLEMNDAIDFWKSKGLDLSNILARPYDGKDVAMRCFKGQKHNMEKLLDVELIDKAKEALESKKPVKIDLPIKNTNLTTGAMLSGEITKRYGREGLCEDTIVCAFKGSAGQSFGAFATYGLTLVLEGEANDYLGKGMCGGKIIVKLPKGSTLDASKNTICGNVLLYGATFGEVYINGLVGERFAIRNSGVNVVVEGAGDHSCEYMTGGRVVILGDTGVNFAAGMSGGIAYVYDPNSKFDGRCNLDMVDLEIVSEDEDIVELRTMIEKHFQNTGSLKARDILDNWESCLPSFVKVFPMEYRKVLGKMTKEDENTERKEVLFK
ncbi:MAG: glutamate synthase large subunit [Candidatus Zapsychrus exili]|nr:glutamate synthase large subunit [Candidatus Zapsychrus exili]